MICFLILVRKEIPCRFFKKGFCTNGSRCEFLHEASTSPSDRSSTRRSSPPSSDHHSGNHNHHSSPNTKPNDEDWEVEPSTDIPDSAQSPPQEEQMSVANFQPRTTSRFSDAPLSPTPEDESPSSPPTMGGANFGASGAGEGTKVIPV